MHRDAAAYTAWRADAGDPFGMFQVQQNDRNMLTIQAWQDLAGDGYLVLFNSHD